MTNVEEKAENQLRDIAACPICMNVLTDPKLLPCIHKLCIECLKRTAEEEHVKPGDMMPCSLCQEVYTIPTYGMTERRLNGISLEVQGRTCWE